METEVKESEERWRQISIEHTSVVDIQNYYKKLKMKFIDADFPPMPSSLY